MNSGEVTCSLARTDSIVMERSGTKTMPRARWMVTAAFVMFLSFSPAQSQQPHPTESQVKAAYLYNFGKFVRWPEDNSSSANTFEICVLGKDPFASVLDATVANENLERKAIRVRRVSNMPDAGGCNILFISLSEEGRLKFILAATQSLSVLTVSEISHFADRGGDIGFVMQEDKIRFEVNLGAAQRSHLKLSSELLKVATKVIGGTPQS